MISVTEMAEILRSQPYKVWNGVLGYDTRPYVGPDPLPVEHEIEFAEAFREPIMVEEFGLEKALASLEAGEVVTIPDYLGCNYQGEWAYKRTPYGFVALGYSRAC